MANIKEIKRTERFEIRMTEKEKEIWYKCAEEIGIHPSRMARNIILEFAESTFDRRATKMFVKIYKSVAEMTKNQEVLDRLNSQ